MRFLIPLLLIPLTIGIDISHFVYNTLCIGTVAMSALSVYVVGYFVTLASFTFLGGYDNQKSTTMKHKFQWGLIFSIVWPWIVVISIEDRLKNKPHLSK